MAIYFFDKNQTLIKIVPESATFEAIQTQEFDDGILLKDTLSVTVKGDEKLLNAEYMAVKSYKGNAQTFDMYRILTDTTPDKSMSFTGMSLAPYELNGHIIQDLRPANHSLSYTLNRVLDGTDWRVGYIEDGLSNVTTTFYYVSAKEALKELQSLVGCEFVFKVEISGQKITDKWIEVYSEMGNRTKKRFNYGTNALTVVRETNKADIFTALIGRGKGEEVSSGEDNASGQSGYGRKITFEDIEWKKSSGKPLDKPKGQYYLELPQATQAYGIKNIDGTMKARVGIVDFDDEEDKNRLINLTYQQLLVSSRPKVLFKTTVANIGATGIGDTVTIHRHDLNIHYQTRVRKIVRNKLNDNKTQIELGDAVVTASTKQAKKNNATIKNLNQELERVKADVTTSQNSADGKNTIFYGSAEPERQRTGDTWYRPHPSIAGETQMLTWNGTAWELVIDTSDLTSVSREVEDASKIAGEAVQAAKDADARAGTALEKAGANANLLTTHQNTLNTIKNTTLPDINKSLSDAIGEAQTALSSAGSAMSEAKSALSSAGSAMDEAKKADGKIADYVTKNGLVNGTTVDSKIDTATGEISKKITTLETNKLDGTTYTNFYNNEYKKTAQGVTDTWEAVKKVVDENGNTTDTFAQAVYERNADRQKASFKKVTDDLVTTTTYNAGVEGINENISTVQGNLDNLQVGGRNLLLASELVNSRYLDKNSGEELPSLFHTASGFVKVDGDTNYTASSANGVWFIRMVFYDANKEYLSGKILIDQNEKMTMSSPKDSVFMRVSVDKQDGRTDLNTLKLEKGNIATDWTPAPEDMQSVSDLDDNITSIYNNTSSETSKAINRTLSAYTKDTDFDTKTQSYLTNNQYQTASQITTTLGAYTKTSSLDSTVASYLNNSTSSTAGAINTKLTAYQTTTGLDSSVSSLLSNTNSQTAKGFNSKLTAIEGKIPTEIGGRNLVLNTEGKLYRTYGTGAKLSEVNGATRLTWTSSNQTSMGEKLSVPLNVGETYTLSFEARGTITTPYLELYILTTSGANLNFTSVLSDRVVTNKFKKYTATFKFTGSPSDRLFIGGRGGSGTWLEVKDATVKLEKGSIATDWSPAPEDMLGKSTFTTFTSEYEDTAKGIMNRLTAIDSGKEGSLLYNANEALSTAKGNTRTITTLDTKVDNLKVGGENLLSTTADGYADGYIVGIGEDGLPPVFRTYDRHTISAYIDIGNKGVEEEFVFTKKTVGGDEYFRIVWISEFGNVLRRDTPGDNVFVTKSPSNAVKVRFSFPTGSQAMMQRGNKPTEYTPSLQDQLGKADFTLFENTYNDTARSIENRLTAIDSTKEGSVVTRLNKTESTASGNKKLITTINNSYVTQKNIDDSILSDKQIIDTRNTNELPPYYYSKYPKQEVREFKTVSVMGIGSGTYGILTTNVPWNHTGGGRVQQTFDTETEKFTRQGQSSWSAWVKQIDTADSTYQKITETSNLYERVIGSSSEASVKQNMARIVMTDSAFQTEIVDKQDLRSAMASGTGMTSDPYFDKGTNRIGVYDNGKTNTITVKRTKIPSTTSIPVPKGNDGYRLDIAHSASSATTPNRGGVARNTNGWVNGTVVVKFVAYLPVGRSFSYHNNALGTGATQGWLTDNKGTGKWETYMYYYRFGTGTISNFGHLSVTGSSSAFTWYLSEYDIINVNETSASKITQLSDNINLKVSKTDLISQINVQAGGVLITSGTNKLNVTPTTTYIENGTIKSAMIESLSADKIKTGSLDAGKVKVINIDAENITANITDFIKTNWNEATGGGVTITGSGVRAINSEGSRVTLENGVVSVGNRAGVNLGFFGDHILNKSSTGTMTITASYGTETAFISATGTDGKTYKRSMSIMAGAGEIDMFTTLNMNKNALKDVTDIGFTGGLIKGNINGSARYMTIEAGTGTAFDVSGVTRMSVTSVVNIFSGIDMKGNDIASVGKLTYNSDQRLKTNIKDTNIRALDAIRNWKLVSYDWLESGEHVEIGLIAQNSPEVMTYNDESDIYSIDAGKQTMINTLGIQQLDSKVDNKVEQLEAKIASLQEELATLKGD